ncbi:MAG: YqaA family protein, partial [Acinetobacter pittii]
ILGSILNYIIGLKGIHWIVKRNEKREKKLENLINKYGAIILILVPWIPLIGDPLTIVAGALKMKFEKFLLWISIGRFIKIFVIVFIGMEILKFKL